MSQHRLFKRAGAAPRTGNPSDHSRPKSHRAYDLAKRADEGYSRELKRVYGPKIASEMRYKPREFKDSRLILARKRFERATRVLRSVWEKNRAANPGRKSVHTAKWDDCVRDVKRSGSKVSPYAVCSSAIGYEGSVKKGHRRGNPIYDTVKLRNGVTVLAKPYKDRLMAYTYSNLTQANKKAAEVGGYVTGHRPYFIVVEVPKDRAMNPTRHNENPLPKVKTIRPIYYIVCASKGAEHFYLKRSGKLTRNAVDAARFRTTTEAIDKAKRHLAQYAASRKFRFDIKLAY